MDKFIRFWGTLRLRGKIFESIFFYIDDTPAPHSLDQSITLATRENRIGPDFLLFIVNETKKVTLLAALTDEILSERFQLLHRCKFIAVLSFNKDSELAIHWIIGNEPYDSSDLLEIFRFARSNCFKFLCDSRHGVVTTAPPGTYFSNPSGRKQSYFLRAGPLCRNSTEASFIAFCLLPLVAKARRVYNNSPNLIWVDTVGIAYLAYALAKLGKDLNAFDTYPEVRSFSSYSGYKALSPKSGEYPIFLISASTSGNLAALIEKENFGKIDPNVISTILGSYPCEFPQLIFPLPDNLKSPSLSAHETLREIKVSGEDFLFKPGAPIAVDLKKPQLPKDFPEKFRLIQGKELIHCFKKVDGMRSAKAFCIDSDRLIDIDEFRQWTAEQARGRLPASVKRIVYQNDPASRQMALIVQETLLSFSISTEISSIPEVESMTPQINETVAVVAGVVGSGMELMRATKALRIYQPNGSRYFILGILLGRTYRQLQQLKSNLGKTEGGRTFSVQSWCEFSPTNEALAHFRDREIAWLKETKETDELSLACSKRLETISTDGVIKPGAEAPCTLFSLSTKAEAFAISDGFALWKHPYKKLCSSDVLFTVACWLQHAREDLLLKSSDRLDDGGFGQTIISPDCFVRFTDAVIQSAIIRCARDSELDYRSSPEYSARAAAIVSKLFELQEESSLEFLLAIAFNRMRLQAADRDLVIRSAENLRETNVLIPNLIEKIKANS